MDPNSVYKSSILLKPKVILVANLNDRKIQRHKELEIMIALPYPVCSPHAHNSQAWGRLKPGARLHTLGKSPTAFVALEQPGLETALQRGTLGCKWRLKQLYRNAQCSVLMGR